MNLLKHLRDIFVGRRRQCVKGRRRPLLASPVVTHIVLDTSWRARLGSPRIPGLPSPGRCLECRRAQGDARS